MSKVLNSWQEIANYLGKGVRTVQRWEQEFALPIRRRSPDGYVIFAIPGELDAWVQQCAIASLRNSHGVKQSRADHGLLVKALKVGVGRLKSNRQQLLSNLDRLHAHIAAISEKRACKSTGGNPAISAAPDKQVAA